MLGDNLALLLAARASCACSTFRAWAQGMNRPVTPASMTPPANIRPPGLKNVGHRAALNQQVPLDLAFRDETGKAVHLADYFGKKPVILNLVYYKCPMLCSQVLTGLTSLAQGSEV